MQNTQQLSLCGIRLDAIRQSDLIELLNHAILNRERWLVLHHNLHSLYLYETDAAVKALYSRASCVYIDGLPIVWLSRSAGLPVTTAHRITFLDSFENILCAASDRGWRVFYLGSTQAGIAKGLELLRDRYPRLIISGSNGFFIRSGPENEKVISQINNFRTDILFVGMGMPLQEVWLAENYVKLDISAALTSGATLDYITGDAYRPPKWAGSLGLYGIFRMLSDPKRLWRRYLLEPLLLTKYLLPRLIGHWSGQLKKSNSLRGLFKTTKNSEAIR